MKGADHFGGLARKDGERLAWSRVPLRMTSAYRARLHHLLDLLYRVIARLQYNE
jgi:hypothetical protein